MTLYVLFTPTERTGRLATRSPTRATNNPPPESLKKRQHILALNQPAITVDLYSFVHHTHWDPSFKAKSPNKVSISKLQCCP
ncbi:hypothetical protein CHS0354_016127, partial [Potamilus streckersoni]